jgi:hypothetical protein
MVSKAPLNTRALTSRESPANLSWYLSCVKDVVTAWDWPGTKGVEKNDAVGSCFLPQP